MIKKYIYLVLSCCEDWWAIVNKNPPVEYYSFSSELYRQDRHKDRGKVIDTMCQSLHPDGIQIFLRVRHTPEIDYGGDMVTINLI